MSWRVRAAQTGNLPAILELLSQVDGDRERPKAGQFVVAEDGAGAIIGSARLKPYPGFVELASVAIAEGWRGQGVGREMVALLLENFQGQVYLMCEDNRVAFFGQFGFQPLPEAQMPRELGAKWRHYLGLVTSLNLMRRE